MDTVFSLNQIGVYHPKRQSAKLTESLFVARQNEFNLIMESLNEEMPDSVPQHHLILAQRGMGKTTLLIRIDVELHKEQYKTKYIPILFAEEQYNLIDLVEFWLNSFDALIESLEKEGYNTEEIRKIEKNNEAIKQEYKDSSDLGDKLYKYFMSVCKHLGRRPVLLIDNIGLAFKRLSKQEQHILRAYLSENGCPVVISAGVAMAGIRDTKEYIVNYKMPFYEFFQSHKLKKLDMNELIEILYNLSKITKIDISITAENKTRLQSLFQLTGGNPRTVVMLFNLITKGFSESIVEDLEALLDSLTPYNKSRFEELPIRQQIILNAIAQNWDPIHISELSKATRYKNSELSPHLNHLVEAGWVETTKVDTQEWDANPKKSKENKVKGNVYSMSERFLSIWLIMRNGRRQRKKEIKNVLESYQWIFGKSDSVKEAKQQIENELMTKKEKELIMKGIKDACKEKDYHKAMKMVDQYDNKLEKLSAMGFIQMSSGNPNEAENHFREALTIENENAANWTNLGHCLTRQKKYDEAESAFKKAISLNKNDTDNWNSLFQILLKQKKQKETEQEVQKMITLNEKDTNAWTIAGSCFEETGNHFEAEKAYKRAIKIDPHNLEARIGLSELYIEINRNDEAEKEISKVVELDTDGKNAGAIGQLYFIINKVDEAEKFLQHAISIDDTDVMSWRYLSRVLIDQGNYSEAEKALNRSFEFFKECPYDWNLLGFCLFMQNKNTEAENAFRQATAFENDNADFWIDLGLALSKQAKYKEAIEIFNKALKFDPQNADAFYLLGNVYGYMNDYSKAIKYYSKSLKINPSYSTCYNDRGFAYSETKQSRKALSDYSSALAIDPNNAKIYVNRGWEYLRGECKDYDKAIEDLTKAIELDENSKAKKLLIHFYRDISNQIDKSRELFNTFDATNTPKDVYYLEQTLFALHERNEGIAGKHLSEALKEIEEKLNPQTNNSWEYFAAITIKLGYAKWLLSMLSENGFDIILSPFYVAIQALEIERTNNSEMAEIYLKNQAIEKSEPARMIIERMRIYR